MVDRGTFGMWARGRRRALDLTQHQMAELVGCATVTIRKIEADERRPSKVMAMQFAKVLGIDAGDFDGFVAAARGFRAPATGVGAPHEIEARLPVALTRFVGREGELDGLLWFCENCNAKLFEEYFQLTDIVNQLQGVFRKFYCDADLRTCNDCGAVMEPPPVVG